MRTTATIVYLLIYIVLVQFLEWNQWMQFFNLFLLVTLGLAHGSNDLEVYAATSKRSILSTTVLYYFTTIVLTVGCYLASPLACLILYIVISGYHFGEELLDRPTLPPVQDKVLATLLGCTIFSFMFVFNIDEFNEVISLLVDYSVSETFMLIATIALLLCTIIYWQYWKKRQHLSTSGLPFLFMLMGFGFMFWWTDLLTSFTLFFVLWHSLPSLLNQARRLYGSRLGKVWMYLKKALPIYLISIIGIAVLVLCFRESDNLPIYLLLAGIIVTSPHIIAISKLYRNQSTP